MLNDAMQGTLAKLDRAEEHLKQLQTEFTAPNRPGFYGGNCVIEHNDLQTREHVFEYRMPPELVIRYGIIAGEVIGQIRSALDQIVYNLVPSPTHRTGFPVVEYQRNYPSQRKVKIDGINSTAATIIEGLQPFNNGGIIAPLWILNELWNRDKHRILNIAGDTLTKIHRLYTLPDGTTRRLVDAVNHGTLKEGAEILRLPFPDFDFKTCVISTLEISLKFWDAGPATNREVYGLLHHLLRFGKSTVNALIRTS